MKQIIIANELCININMGRVLYYMLKNNMSMNDMSNGVKFSKKLEGLYRRKFELKDLISHASTNRELEDKITRLESELARIESLIDKENIRLYGSNDEPLKRVF